jgi:Ca-activated chloride channel family protein
MSSFDDIMRMVTGTNWQFMHPWFLLGLLAVPVLAWMRGSRGGAPAVEFSSTEILQTLGKSAESKPGNFLTALFYVGLAALIVGLARPQGGKSTTQIQASGIDIMILIDVSGSMLTEDYELDGHRANRQEAIRTVTKKFIEQRPNDRIGIIAFASRPYLVSPMTLDHDWLFQNLDRVKIGQVEDGTAIGSAIASGINRLKDRGSKSKVLILLTDGDNNAGKVSPPTAAQAAKALGVKLYAIGAGTNGEAPVPLFDQRTGQPMVDQNGQTVLQMQPVEFDETGLKNVAAIAGGHYYRAADTDSLRNIFADIDKLEKTTVEYKKTLQFHDLYPWFLMAGFAMIGTEMLLGQTVWRRLP